ncbi:hypothetical protein [Streptomyces sp. NPDC051994]|uniref:hypothetical protein n=1 Tax=unclassified Streptomyces TaxID=2593676 RepID=UPI0034163D19
MINALETASTQWTLDKLLDLISELIDNYAEQRAYACQMLLRALIDHVPPIFGQRTFDGVAASTGWVRTDKTYMKALAVFRKSGDDVLHRQLTTRPSRISMHDMPPSAYINALLQGVLDHL